MIEILKFEDFNLEAIGNTLEISGVIYTDGIQDILIMLPEDVLVEPIQLMLPTQEQWQQIVRQSDLKEVEGMDKGKKIILRKSTRQIEQKIMWEVFRRDSFTCRYCNTASVPMTVDHVVLWEEMGPSVPVNLLTSCKKCNNIRGNMQYEDWIKSERYLSRAVALSSEDLARNAMEVANIPYIKENLLRTVKRSR